MKATVRTLNHTGLGRFRAWLQEGAVGEAPFALLTDESASEPLPGARDVETGDFPSRFELATHVLDALADCDVQRLGYAPGLWEWLALFYIDLLCPRDRAGRRTVLELARYILLPEYRRYYRHLVREPVMLVRRHGEFARVLLVSRGGRFRISKVFEEIAARQDLISNPGVVELVWRLYFNPGRRTVRPGVAGNDRPGGIRRFALVLQQLSLNYDLPGMTAEELAGLLPREFDGWRRRAHWEPVAAAGRPPEGDGRRLVRFGPILAGSEWRRSQLADLWGYRSPMALGGPLLAPRGLDALILFVDPKDRWEPDRSGGMPEGRTFTWTGEADRSVDRRLTVAAREDRTVHVFRRTEPRRAFTYLGPCRLLASTPRAGLPTQFVFRLPADDASSEI